MTGLSLECVAGQEAASFYAEHLPLLPAQPLSMPVAGGEDRALPVKPAVVGVQLEQWT